MACDHTNKAEYEVNGRVNYFEDTKGYLLEVAVRCKRCHMPMRFLGLPVGLNMYGAAVDPMGTELRVAVMPADKCEAPIMTELNTRDPKGLN